MIPGSLVARRKIVFMFALVDRGYMSKHQKDSAENRATPAEDQSQQHDSAPPSHEAGAASESAAELSSSAVEVALEAKEKELADLKDKYLRALADGENARKRIRQQSEESVRIQREGLLRDLLPIVDNLERALEAAKTSNADSKTIIKGVEMVLHSMMDFLRVQGVTPLQAVGQRFDPARHEAVDHVESAAHEANHVVQEFHRGYQIGDRVLRTARVSVSKGSGGQKDGETDSSDVENS